MGIAVESDFSETLSSKNVGKFRRFFFQLSVFFYKILTAILHQENFMAMRNQ